MESHPTPPPSSSPDESVDLLWLDIIQLLDGLFDLALVGLEVHDEDQGVVVLNLLHGRFGGERVFDNPVLIKLVQ